MTDYYSFDKDEITVQHVEGSSVLMSFGHDAYSMTPETARSLLANLIAALLVADGKQTIADILAAAEKIRAEEF